MKKQVRWGIIVLIAAGLVGLGVRTFMPHNNKDLEEAPGGKKGKKDKVLNVTGKIMKYQKMSDGLSVSGSLLPDEEVQLSFETSGKITHINFKEGSHVHKGQLLAKVNDAPLQAQLRKLQAQLKLTRDRVYRQNALLAKEAVSKEAYEEAQTNLATLNAEIDMVKANIAQTELKAPFDGIIGLRQVSAGTYASPTTVIATLTKTKPLKIEFAVPERYASQLKNGTNLAFTIEGNLNTLHAKVYATDSKVDMNTHTYTMRAIYPNADGKLLPGRYASIKLQTREIDNALAVPSEAIVSEMGIDKVFLFKSGVAEPVEIIKGLRNESEVQVLKGLNIGDTILTTGIMQLRTGQKVTLDRVE